MLVVLGEWRAMESGGKEAGRTVRGRDVGGRTQSYMENTHKALFVTRMLK